MRSLKLALALASITLAACSESGDERAVPPAGTQAAAAELPDDVIAFQKQRDACDHFRGEEPYDAARAKFIETRLDELCTGTDQRLAELRAKYRDRADVAAALSGYEAVVE
ncbi:MAG TPA: hypothetical protein VF699_13380 [Caulobacteraceae bacterium]